MTAPRTDVDIVALVLAHEGGYTNNPADPGGPTNFGVTQADLAAARGHAVSATDVAALGPGEASRILLEKYVRAPGYDAIADLQLRSLVADCAVLHGPGTATRWLQHAVGVTPDGSLGPKTRAALATSDVERVYLSICASRARAFGQLLLNPARHVFASGWLNRLAGFLDEAP